MLLPASILPPAALVAAIAFLRPHALWVQGVFLLSAVFLILLSVALVGVNTGGEFYERHLTIMLFVAVTAIIIFPIPLGWAMTIGAFCPRYLPCVSTAKSRYRSGAVLWPARCFSQAVWLRPSLPDAPRPSSLRRLFCLNYEIEFGLRSLLMQMRGWNCSHGPIP